MKEWNSYDKNINKNFKFIWEAIEQWQKKLNMAQKPEQH